MSPSGLRCPHLRSRRAAPASSVVDEAHVVLGGGVDFLHERVGNQFACLIMAGVDFEHFRIEGPVFMELGGELHKITVYRCAALALEPYTREHSVKPVAKFVEHWSGRRRW